MATLQIRPRDPSQARTARVTITLVNSTSTRVDGYVTATGAPIVLLHEASTNSAGELDVDLTPNADITPANTYYLVSVAGRASLIEKSGATQAVLSALVANPTDGTPILTGIGLDGGAPDSIYGGTTAIDGGTP